MASPKIYCIIPAFNEEKTIIQVIRSVKPLVYKVVVVDDGSTDRTYELAGREGVVLLHHIINRDQGAALQTGNQYALREGADIIVHFDADGQFLAEEIKEVVGPLERGEAEVVFGSRFLGQTFNMPRLKKNVIMPLVRMFNKIFLGVNLIDPQSGFRAFSRAAAEKIKIENDGMAHCGEIMSKTFKNDLRFKEVPITVIYHHFGQSLSGGIRILKDLFLSYLIRT